MAPNPRLNRGPREPAARDPRERTARDPRERPARDPRERPARDPRERPDLATREDVAFGRNPVLEAARAGRVRRVRIARGLDSDPRLDEIRERAQVEEVDARQLDGLLPGAVHQGVLADLHPRQFLPLRDLLETRPTLLVALDSIQDPQNLGAILRSAEAAGADGAILPEHRSAPLSAAAVKASSGAVEHLRLSRVAGVAGAIPEIKKAGIWTVALDPRGEMLPWEFDFAQPVCVVVGGEGPGVHRLVRERCDARLRLPMAGRVESLNASAAAAVLLYEVARQRATRA